MQAVDGRLMAATVFTVGFALAATCAFGRVAGVLVGVIRSWTLRHRFDVVRFGWIETLTLVEPAVMAAVTAFLIAGRPSASTVSPVAAGMALAGGCVTLLGAGLALWTLASWRQLFVGHAVLSGQQLVTDGSYGLVRHPVYLAAVLIWIGLAVCFGNFPTALLTAGYVLPVYLLYIRSEEKMMLDAFGPEYRRYREQVPMLLPRLVRRSS